MAALSFGPQLIGQTEKALNALLRRALEGTGLTEPAWVTLRLADQLDGRVDAEALADAVADRAQYDDAAAIVDGLRTRGLLVDGRLSDDGRQLLATVRDRIDRSAGPIWADLPPDDVAATARILNELLLRARTTLAG